MNNKYSMAESLFPSKTLMAAIYKILRPLVRLLIRHGITFPQMAELLKRAYVDVCSKEFNLPNKQQTGTRLSLLTGVHRKDIKRLSEQLSQVADEPDIVSIGSQIVSLWVSEKIYQDKDGKPLPLPLTVTQGEISFEKLVQRVCKQDIRPRAVLDQWKNLEVITIDKNKYIHLNTHAFIPRKGFDEKSFFLGHNVADHLAAACDNLSNDAPPFFERCVYYDALSAESVEKLEALVATKGMQTLLEINELAMRLKAMEKPGNKSLSRIDIGLYMYHETQAVKDQENKK